MTDENEIETTETVATAEGMPEKNEEQAETASTSTDVDASVAAQNQLAADSTVSEEELKAPDNDNQPVAEETNPEPTWESIKADTKKLIADAQAVGVNVTALLAETLAEV